MVTMSDDPTSAAMPFEQFTDNDGADYDKRLFFIIDNIEGSSLFEKSCSSLIYMFNNQWLDYSIIMKSFKGIYKTN